MMHRVHVIGGSFTNWVYPTWGDYIQRHYDVEFHNLGFSASGNSVMKKKLYTVDKSDHVFIMFSGPHRHIVGIDEEFIRNYVRDVKTKIRMMSILKLKTTHWFRTKSPASAFVNSDFLNYPKQSKFQEYYQMLENIYDCQNYLQAKGIEYNFALWQGFYNDLSNWQEKRLKQKTIDDSKYMQNSIYNKVFNSIDYDKFLMPIKKGLWEHMGDNKELLSVQSAVDTHPSTLCHFDFFKTYIKPILDQKMPNKNNIDHLYSQSKKFSEYYQKDATVQKEYTEQLRTKYIEIFEDL